MFTGFWIQSLTAVDFSLLRAEQNLALLKKFQEFQVHIFGKYVNHFLNYALLFISE